MASASAAPTWDFDFSQTSNYQGFAQRDLNISLIVFSTLFVSARLYVRAFMTKSLGLDDLMTVAAYLILCVFSGLEIRSESLHRGGITWPNTWLTFPSCWTGIWCSHR